MSAFIALLAVLLLIGAYEAGRRVGAYQERAKCERKRIEKLVSQALAQETDAGWLR